MNTNAQSTATLAHNSHKIEQTITEVDTTMQTASEASLQSADEFASIKEEMREVFFNIESVYTLAEANTISVHELLEASKMLSEMTGELDEGIQRFKT